MTMEKEFWMTKRGELNGDGNSINQHVDGKYQIAMATMDGGRDDSDW